MRLYVSTIITQEQPFCDRLSPFFFHHRAIDGEAARVSTLIADTLRYFWANHYIETKAKFENNENT